MNKKKKIAVVVDNEFDADVRVKKEIKMLLEVGFEVAVLCFGFEQSVWETYPYRVERIRVKRRKKQLLYLLNNIAPFYNNLWTKHLCEFLKSEDFDAVHAHDLYMAKASARAIKQSKRNISLILDLHENYPVAYAGYSWVTRGLRPLITLPKKWLKKEAHYLAYADGVIVLSEDYQKDLQEKYVFLRKKRMLVLPNIPDVSIFKELPKKKKDRRITFLYFGVISERRGVFQVMDAFIKLQDTLDTIQLLLIGPVDKSDRETFFRKKSKIHDTKIRYIDWIPLAKLPDYMVIADVGLAPFHVNPQHESGIANKLFQYMFGNLPILASNCKPQRELIERHAIGKIFTDQESLERTIQYFAENREQLEEMASRSKPTLLNHYTLEKFTTHLKDFYDQLFEHSHSKLN